jgi:hypothetical protein
MMPALVTSVLVAAAVFVILAFLVRRSPRASGRLLLGLCVVAFAFAIRNLGDARIAWGQFALMLQAFLVLGVTGIALVVESDS